MVSTPCRQLLVIKTFNEERVIGVVSQNSGEPITVLVFLKPFPTGEDRTFTLGELIAYILGVTDIVVFFLGMAWSLPILCSSHRVEAVLSLVGEVLLEFIHQVVAKTLSEKNLTTTLSGILFI